MNKSLKRDQLERARTALELAEKRAEQGAIIKAFYKAAGGVKNVADKAGTTTNALHINRQRGYLPKTHKHELLGIASEYNFLLPETIFIPI